MGIEERRERDRQNLRQAILDVAEKLFVEEGYERVTMRRIASEIEYSPTTIYLYFSDKNEIFYTLLEQYYEKLLAIMLAVDEGCADPIDRIRKGMRAYTDFGLAHPNYYKLAFMFTPELRTEDYMNPEHAGTKVFMTLRDNVAACVERGLFHGTDIDLIAQAIWSVNHGITSLMISNPNYPWADRERVIDETVELTVRGLIR